MIRQVLILFLLLCLSLSSGAVNLDIALFYRHDITGLSFQAASGEYRLKGDYDHLGDYKPGVRFSISAKDGKVLISKGDSTLGTFRAIAFRGESFKNSFQIKPENTDIQKRIYDDDLKVLAEGEYLKIINHVGLEHYVAGVVQSEGGGSSNDVEFYQVQAITCRTYALNNHRKHLDKGFNLCDDVHCQVYKGKAQNSDILLAAMRTSGEVIIDESKRMISASFHSNCGGQTMNSEDVWSIATPYLKSVRDTFCSDMPHSSWKYKMPKNEWLEYLKKKHDYNLSKEGALDKVLAFQQENRKVFLADSIPLKAIRRDMDLNSTFFSISVQDSMVVFDGKGFGHGVGMCQEGAINMVKKGYSYKDIIHYYYRNVQIVNFHELPYLLEEFNKDNQEKVF